MTGAAHHRKPSIHWTALLAAWRGHRATCDQCREWEDQRWEKGEIDPLKSACLEGIKIMDAITEESPS